MKNNLSPRTLTGLPDYNSHTGYAYHMDAALHGEMCKKQALAHNVKQIIGEVVEVGKDKNGYIKFLKTKNNELIHGDFFIDCSGFRGTLIKETLEEPFNSYEKTMLCDRAVVLRTPHTLEKGNTPSCTTATAVKNGWIWHIPLQTHNSFGYVYASAFSSEKEAEKELRDHVGKASNGQESRQIKMRAGVSRRHWVKNCVAIGLAGGFIEPLESSGLLLMQLGVEGLINYFPDKNFDPFLIDEYNRLMQEAYDRVHTFIMMHYFTTNREDTPFWKANKNNLKYSNTINDILRRWNKGVLVRDPRHLLESKGIDLIFGYKAYIDLLTGVGVIPERTPMVLNCLEFEKVKPKIDRYFREIKRHSTQMPDHSVFLMQS
jgi:tryptophan 6-halogenase